MDTSHFHLRPLITNTRTAPSSLLLERKAFQCADHYCTVPDTLLYRSLVSLLLQCYSHCSTVFPTLYCSMNIYTILPESQHCTVWHTVDFNESLFSRNFNFQPTNAPLSSRSEEACRLSLPFSESIALTYACGHTRHANILTVNSR